MAVTLIEATSAKQLEDFQQTLDYREFLSPDATVTKGVQIAVELEGVDEQVDIHWLLIEDSRPEDNCTYRINNAGQAEYWSSGVEV